MKKAGMALALLGAVSAVGMVDAEMPANDASILTIGTSDGEGYEAIREEHIKSYLADLFAYIKANIKADDAGDAVIELMTMASQIDDTETVTKAVMLFREKNPEHKALANINVGYASMVLAAGDLEGGIEAIEAAFEAGAGNQELSGLYMGLATIQAANMDVEGAKATYDQIADLFAGNQQAKQYIKQMKNGLKKIGKPFKHFVAEDLDGNEVDTEKLEGKVVLYDYWATW